MKIPSRRHPAAFTLIELMAVITIIVILAGMVVGGLGYVNEKQAREKAKIQIALLSKALEEYKLDNGTYPPTGDAVNPGKNNTNILFKALYWDGFSDPTGSKKIYLPELDPANNKQGWIEGTGIGAFINDPWGGYYRYRTATNSSGATNTKTQNPDFDLWSNGKDGTHSAETGNGSLPFDKKVGDKYPNRDNIQNF